MILNNFKKIHFIGIGGIGTSAIAKMMLKKGKNVSGSDIAKSEITEELEKLGAKIFTPCQNKFGAGQVGHSAKNLADDVDLVIYSPAVPQNNSEIKKAFRLQARGYKLQVLSYPEFIGQLSKNKFTIAVSGTNGKSTTTAMLGLILEKAGLDPTVIVGSKVPQWKGNLRLSTDFIRNKSVIRSPLVVEACEWRAHMLNLNPQIIILTNLEEDHLDYYQDINHLVRTFQKYIDKLPSKGSLILNADDSNLKKLKPKCKVITYGINNKADLMAQNIIVKNNRQEFDLIFGSDLLSFKNRKIRPLKLKIKIPGIFNIYNVLAASAASLSLGVKPKVIKKVLENFKGIWRRFEVKELKIKNRPPNCRRKTDKLKIVSDYAHHPTAVRETIKAAKEFYPHCRIVAVFQPHHRNRTKKLFNDFVQSFDMADLIILSEIYDVAGREKIEDMDISSKDLVNAIRMRMQIKTNKNTDFKEIFYTKDLAETKKRLLEIIQPGDVVLIMGAGDIYKLIPELESELRKQ